MEKEVFAKYKQAHDISDEVIEFAEPLVKEGAKTLDIAEKIEKLVSDREINEKLCNLAKK